VDIGNGPSNLVSNQGETRIDSYVHYLSERASMGVNSGYVEYFSGDRADLIGKQWIGGLEAYYHGLRAIYRVTDTPTGKAELGLQLLLSALSMLPYRSEWNLHLVCSVHDGRALGSSLKTALEGVHHVTLAASDRPSRLPLQPFLKRESGRSFTTSATSTPPTGFSSTSATAR
jgi:hypothetical protein